MSLRLSDCNTSTALSAHAGEPGVQEGQVLALDLAGSSSEVEVPSHVFPACPAHRWPARRPRQQVVDGGGEGPYVALAHQQGSIRADRLGHAAVPGRDDGNAACE